MIDLTGLSTEARNPRTLHLDEMDPRELVGVMNEEDHCVADAVGEVLDEIAQAISWGIESVQQGGRIVYFGAGTSGRLGVLDAVECPPTFGVAPDVVVGLMAGGESAFVSAVEGAEDSPALCAEELDAIGLTSRDLAVGIAASGRTPYVAGGLRHAKEKGCRTVAIACNKGSAIAEAADLAIEPCPGPEVLTGSTRLKAGTAQKMVLNMLSTGIMVGCGKAYGNLMVDVKQSNEKLASRARNIVAEATGCTPEEAAAALEEAGGSAKTAIVAILGDCTAAEAKRRLDEAQGHVRRALAQG